MPQHAETTNAETERADLETLGTELSALGCKTILTTSEDRQARLDVLNPLAPAITQHIHAQADYFWGPAAQPIAPRTAIPTAASRIAHALSVTPTPTATGTPGMKRSRMTQPQSTATPDQIHQTATALLDGTGLHIEQRRLELIVTNPCKPENGQVCIALDDAYVTWERTETSYWGHLEGIPSRAQDTRTVPAAKIINTLTTRM